MRRQSRASLACALIGLALPTVLAACPGASCPERFAYCKGDVRHYCVDHQGSVVPDFTIEWATQDCAAEGGLRCVEEGNDATCR